MIYFDITPRGDGKTTRLLDIYHQSENPIYITYSSLEYNRLRKQGINIIFSAHRIIVECVALQRYNTILIDEYFLMDNEKLSFSHLLDLAQDREIYISGTPNGPMSSLIKDYCHEYYPEYLI